MVPAERAAADQDARASGTLAALINDHAGLDATHAPLARKIAQLAEGDAAGLAALLVGDDLAAPEWQRVLGALVARETYFFRDMPQLQLLAACALAPILRRAEAGPLRIWSAGCCTGEEAYSLAIVALEAMVAAGCAIETPAGVALVDGWGLDVLGTDILAASLADARAGQYRTGAMSSFRLMAAAHLRFFPEQGPAMRRVRSDVARQVRFVSASLARPADRPQGRFDVVSCRNVLLHLAPAARARARAVLCDAVRPGGMMLLGPTDEPPDPTSFSAVWGPRALVYRRHAAPA